MSDAKDDYETRINSVNLAEEKFKELNPNHLKFGFNGVLDCDWFNQIPNDLQCTPDFIMPWGKRVCAVEVKGFKGELKLKFKDFNAMAFWNKLIPLQLFFYDFESNSFKMESFEFFSYLVEKSEHGSFRYNDSKNNCFVIKKWW